MSDKSTATGSWNKVALATVASLAVATFGYWWYSSTRKAKVSSSKPKPGVLLRHEDYSGFHDSVSRFPSFKKVGIAPVLLSFNQQPDPSADIRFYSKNMNSYLVYPLDQQGHPGVVIFFALRDDTLLGGAASPSDKDQKALNDHWAATDVATSQTIKLLKGAVDAWATDDRIVSAKGVVQIALSEAEIPDFSSVSCIPLPCPRQA
jgi:hypothetical protein